MIHVESLQLAVSKGFLFLIRSNVEEVDPVFLTGFSANPDRIILSMTTTFL